MARKSMSLTRQEKEFGLLIRERILEILTKSKDSLSSSEVHNRLQLDYGMSLGLLVAVRYLVRLKQEEMIVIAAERAGRILWKIKGNATNENFIQQSDVEPMPQRKELPFGIDHSDIEWMQAGLAQTQRRKQCVRDYQRFFCKDNQE